MNSNCYKTIFSERLGALVAVGEHANCTGKPASGHTQPGSPASSAMALAVMEGFVGVLRLTFVSVALVCMSWVTAQAQSGIRFKPQH